MSNLSTDAVRLLKEKPVYIEILKRAVEHEEKAGGEHYLGWSWHHVQAWPQTLNSLVVKGLVKVNYSSRSSTYYLLTDKEAIKEAIDFLESQEAAEEAETTVPEDLFDVVAGYEDLKELIIRSLKAERPVHFLFWGVPSTAKSLILLELSRISGASFALGSSVSRAGITNFLLEHKPRILIIDELDKMDLRDYPALLSAMESGYIAELKYKRHRAVRVSLWVFASANRIHKLPHELMSRFYKIHLKEYSKKEFVEVAVKVLTMREGVEPGLAKYIAERLSRRTRDIREAVRLARLAKTKEEVRTVMEIVSRYGGI